MPQDAFTLRHVARELSQTLVGGKISKINQPEKEELSLLIYTKKRTVKLILNVNASDCGVYFCDEEKENPLVAPNFCMLLRKHLQNAEILEVSQVAFERIIAFRLLCNSDFSSCERILYAEVMGKYSNLILTEKGVVMGALKTVPLEEYAKRVLMTGARYALPAPQEKVNPTDFEALSALLPSPKDAKFLFENVAGLAPVTAEQIVLTYRGGRFSKHVYDYIFSEEISPCVSVCKGIPADFFARYEEENALSFSTLSEAQSYFYMEKRSKKRLESGRKKLENAVRNAKKKVEKRLSQILGKYRECEDMEQNRVKGELLTANLYRLSRGMEGCELQNYYDETGGTLKITLDSQLTPSQNAQRYYKKYQKQKRTLEALLPQEKEARREADYLESLLVATQTAAGDEDIKAIEEELVSAGLYRLPPARNKKKREELSCRVYEKEGFRILAGRNNLQNDRLVRSAHPEDIWLHTQKYHSAHVVVQANGKPVPDKVLEYAASVCALFSEGKQGSKIPVDYCAVKFVKKPSGAKAGFVIYTDYQTLLVDPLRESNHHSVSLNE